MMTDLPAAEARAILAALEGLRVSMEHNSQQTGHLAEAIETQSQTLASVVGKLMVEASRRDHLEEQNKNLESKIAKLDERMDGLTTQQAVVTAISKLKVAGVLAGTGAAGAGLLEGLKRLVGE